MENQSASIPKAAMTFGLYLGLALVLNSVIFYVAGAPFPRCRVISAISLLLPGCRWACGVLANQQAAKAFRMVKYLG